MKKIETEICDWSKVTITNRFMFNKVFTNNSEATKRLLEILLNIKIAKIKKPQGEYQIEGSSPENHAVRFDVFTENNKHLYDIEIQTEFEEDLPERSRYYQSMMDIDSLKTGQPYKYLKDSIVIFICTFNPFKNVISEPVRIFENIDINDKETKLNDRTKKIFFNVKEYAKIKNNKELKCLLKFFCENKSETEFTNSLKELVKIAKNNERWRQDYMTYERWLYYQRLHGKEQWMEKGLAEGLAKGLVQGLAQGIAQQKAEDEKRFAQKDAEITRLLEENKRLKALQNKK